MNDECILLSKICETKSNNIKNYTLCICVVNNMDYIVKYINEISSKRFMLTGLGNTLLFLYLQKYEKCLKKEMFKVNKLICNNCVSKYILVQKECCLQIKHFLKDFRKYCDRKKRTYITKLLNNTPPRLTLFDWQGYYYYIQYIYR